MCQRALPFRASWAKYLTSMSVSVVSFSSTGLTSVCRVLKRDKHTLLLERDSQRPRSRGRAGDLQAVEDGSDLLEGLGHVEAHVGHLVIGHLQDHGQHLLGGDFLSARFRQSLAGEEGGVSDLSQRRQRTLTGRTLLTLMQNRVVILWR